MASNRLSYDECAEQQRTQDRITPLDYQLYNTKLNLCQWCGSKSNTRSELTDDERVTIENDLWNINRKQSKCNSEKFQGPAAPPKDPFMPPGSFTPAIVCERDVTWTNIVKPTTPGIPDLTSVPTAPACSK